MVAEVALVAAEVAGRAGRPPAGLQERLMTEYLEDVVERDVHTLQLLDDGPQLLDDGPQLLDDGSQLLDDGPQLLDDGPQLLDDGPQLLDDGPQLLDDGPQLLDDGLQLLEGLCVGSLGSLKIEDARLKGAFGYPTNQLYTPRRHVDSGSRANTSRERGVDDAILLLLQNAGEEKHQEHDEKDEDLL
jgi:uncharacterized phage infection (PIP) family protein YhgE